MKIPSPASNLKVGISPDKYSGKLPEKQQEPQLPTINTCKQAIRINTTSTSTNDTASEITWQTIAFSQPRKPKNDHVKAVIDLYMKEKAEELSTNRKEDASYSYR